MAEPIAKILFVEDDIGKRYVIARQLRALGFEIEEAATGADGLAMLSPDHDVAILDIKLPDMYGWDVCKRIKENPATAAVKVLELSATLASAEDRAKGLDLGADCYLVHPVELVELVAALRALIRLRRAERDRARAQELLIASLGHDLRSPLHIVETGLSVLAGSSHLDTTERETVRRMERTAERMRRMIDQLMVFAQTLGGEIVPVSPQQIDVGELVTQVVRDFRQTLKATIQLDVAGPCPLLGDADKLVQLVENLMTNALRHGEGDVTARVGSDGESAVLAIHNRTPVIPPELIGKLFDPFTRSSRSRGAGLGLYIVDQIARAHRGVVSVTSDDASGTTFTVRLPR
jgi:signal transduction histidine kinase